MVSTIDLYGSLAGLTGGVIPEDAALDTQNVMGALLGEANAKGREDLVQQDNGTAGNYGFRSGNWKLHRHDSLTTRNLVVEKELENGAVPRFQLFDLSVDPGENENLIDSQPEVATRLQARLQEIIDSGRSRP